AALEAGSIEQARKLAAEANRLSPDFVPAAVLEARMLAEEGKKRQARKVLEKAWSASPHPDIARAYADLEPDETPAARRKRFRRLLALRPDDPETRLTEAELAIADEDFVAARKALVELVETRPTARTLTLMAAAERGVGADDSVVRAWLARAVSAPKGRQWVCEKCHHPHPQWQVLCESCGGFDTLAWADAPESEGVLPGAEEMLPLLVGTPLTPEAAGEPEPEPEPEAEPEAEGEGAAVEGEAPEAAESPLVEEPPETPEAVPVGAEEAEAGAEVETPPPVDYVKEDAGASRGQKVEK
ncbi:MAG: heme biosynthesis protein HemY, partial [Alphaproteobacteria bacterium]